MANLLGHSPLGSIELYINTLLLTEKRADSRTVYSIWTNSALSHDLG